MSSSKPSKPSHQPLIEGGSEKPAALRRAQNMAEHVFSRHLKPGVEKAAKAVAPLVERGAHAALLKLADPARARMLQKSMAGLAQWTMDAGFGLDPHARLLFDFVDSLEEEHSRAVVFKIIARHTSGYERDMLELMLKAARGADASKDAEAFRRQRERLGDSLLDLLCELAALESDETPPHTRRAQLAFFEDAPIEARFKVLATMATGDPEAFAAAAQADAAQDNSPNARPPAPQAERSLRQKITGSRLGHLLRRSAQSARGDAVVAPVDAPQAVPETPPPNAKEGVLRRFIPSLNDPATRFLTTSHLFFLQSYLMRTTIEGLPEMLATVADLEREATLSQGDIMTIDPPDDPKK